MSSSYDPSQARPPRTGFFVPATDAERTVQLEDRVFRTDLPGGPTVLSEFVPGVRSASVGLWVRWGSSQERPEQLGISHVLEHMVFKGTERRSTRRIALEIEGIGGSLDAYTAREHTAYHARVLDEHLPIAVDVLSDLVFAARLTARDLEVERNVILEEIAGVEDAPEDLIFDLHAEAVWGDHPYGYPILGSRETVSAITADDLRELRDAVYRPAGCVVVGAGNVRHDELVELVSRNTPRAAGEWSVADVPATEPAPPADRSVERDSAQVHICLGSPTVPYSDPRRYALMLVSTALGGGMSARLFQRIREELGLAYAIYSFQSFYGRGGIGGLYLGTRPDTAERALHEVKAEYARLADSGLGADELEGAKRQAKGQIMLTLESTTARLHRLAWVALYGEPYLAMDEIGARIDAVTERDVAELCGTYYPPERQTVVRLGPDRRPSGGLPGDPT